MKSVKMIARFPLMMLLTIVAIPVIAAAQGTKGAGTGPDGQTARRAPVSQNAQGTRNQPVAQNAQGTRNQPVAQNAPGTLPVVKATFINADSTTPSYQVEIAASEAERDQGLMFRQSMAADRGMLFIFQDDRPRSFWMKNTLIPLDMVFVDSAARVVGIVQNAAPLTLDERKCDIAARYVVELNAFETLKHGIKVGSLVVFDPPLQALKPYRR